MRIYIGRVLSVLALLSLPAATFADQNRSIESKLRPGGESTTPSRDFFSVSSPAGRPRWPDSPKTTRWLGFVIVIFAPVGALTGAFVGSGIVSERWERVWEQPPK